MSPTREVRGAINQLTHAIKLTNNNMSYVYTTLYQYASMLTHPLSFQFSISKEKDDRRIPAVNVKNSRGGFITLF